MDRLREQLRRVVESTPLWDGEVCVLQVTDAREHVVEVRALVSAADGGRAWDLRCLVREKLIAFLQSEYPESLPHLRVEGHSPAPDSV